MSTPNISLEAGIPEIKQINMDTAHFAEAATFGGKPHNYPAWLCGLLHKRRFYSCWSEDKKWGSHVQCGYCQKCRHFSNQKLRYNWLPSDSSPHILHIYVYNGGSSLWMPTNELYLPEILLTIEALLSLIPNASKSTEDAELKLKIEARDSGSSYQWLVSNNLSQPVLVYIIRHLFMVYTDVLQGESILRAEQRWWHRITG